MTTPNITIGNRIACPACNALLLPAALPMQCRHCNTTITNALTPATIDELTPKSGSRSTKKGAEPLPNGYTPQYKGDRMLPSPGQETVFEIIVPGVPITEGSHQIRHGKVVHNNADKLHAWRQTIEDALRAKYDTPTWVPIDSAVRVDAIFTVPRPASEPKTRLTYPDTKPDLDKLTRAVGDALSPQKGRIKSGQNVHKYHFRLLNEDSRITGFDYLDKTYPRPYHTNPAALKEPGLWLRVRVCPPLTGKPGEQPY